MNFRPYFTMAVIVMLVQITRLTAILYIRGLNPETAGWVTVMAIGIVLTAIIAMKFWDNRE